MPALYCENSTYEKEEQVPGSNDNDFTSLLPAGSDLLLVTWLKS